jgi:predicted AlkP superfamily phosphohydrolase/phosphomutase
MRPILLVGLDGATFDVLDPLVAAGEMPTLARLLEVGTRAGLDSVTPPITPAAWSSFMTGKEPGKHGVYDFRVYDPHRYDDAFVTSHALRERTLWELLARAGRRVATVALPMTYPPRPAHGTVVSGFDTPSIEASFTHPPELRQRILERIPDYVLVAVPDASDPTLETDGAFECFVAQVERAFEQRTEVALDLLGDGPWDVLMVHYQDVDVLQHSAWRFIADGATHPARHARTRAVYRRLDDCLRRLVTRLPPETLVVLVSDHGFGAHTGRLFPNALLRRWGYLDWHGRHRERVRRSLKRWLRYVGLAHGSPTTEDPWAVRVRERSFPRALPLRWSRTRAYVALAEIYGLLYVNLRGREPEGIVAPGAERDRLVDELRERLLGVRDPRDGEPAFADVLPGAAVYPQDPYDRRPDLVLVPRSGYTIYRELRPRLWIDHHGVIAGTHRPEGILVAAGPDVRRGTLAERPRLVDLAPTILAAAGVPVPDDMDGRVLSELFAVPPEVTHTAALGAVDADDAVLSATEEEQVVGRLRALGYLT